jgi:hypothetical protein
MKGRVLRRVKADPAAVVQTVAAGQNSPWLLALDGTFVYWTNLDGPSVMRALKDGTAAPQTVASATGAAWGIAVDDTSVYWRDGAKGVPGRVMKVGKDGSNPQQLATTAGEGPRFLAIDDTNVFWTSGDNTNGSVLTAAKDGTDLMELAVSQAGPRGIAVDESNVYWTNYSGATVMKVPKTRDAAKLAHQRMPITSDAGL